MRERYGAHIGGAGGGATGTGRKDNAVEPMKGSTAVGCERFFVIRI
jgi:hypothetical protein